MPSAMADVYSYGPWERGKIGQSGVFDPQKFKETFMKGLGVRHVGMAYVVMAVCSYGRM